MLHADDRGTPAVVGKWGDQIFGVMVGKTPGSLRPHPPVRHRVKRRRSERLLSGPESSSEFFALLEEGYSPAPGSGASDDSF